MRRGRFGNAVILVVATAVGVCAPYATGSSAGAVGWAGDDGSPHPSPAAPATTDEFFYRPTAAAPTIEAVAMVGDAVPGLPGYVYSYFLNPEIDAAGNVFFKAIVSNSGVSSLGIFYGPPGGITKVTRETEAAFGMPGVVVSYVPAAAQNVAENGLMVLTLEVSGPGITEYYNDRVIYVGRPGNFVKVLQAGDQAIDCPEGACYDGSYDDLAGQLSDNGTLFVASALAGAGVTSSNEWGVWIGPPDDLQLVYRDSMQAAECPAGVVYRWADSFSFNDLGQVVFRAGLRGTGITSANDGGHFMGGPGALRKISREGDPATLFGPGVTWRAVSTDGSGTNIWGDVTERAYIQGAGVSTANDEVFLVAADGAFHLLGRKGAPAPEGGPAAYIGTLGFSYLNNRREVLYRVCYAGPGITEANRSSVYFGPYDAPAPIMRDAEAAPTFPAGVVLRHVHDLPVYVALNSRGDIVAPTEIEGPGVTGADNVVLWLRNHVLKHWVPLVCSGDQIGGRIVRAASASDFGYGYCGATGGADGGWQSFNDAGILAIRLEFTDDTHGIFRILPPAFGDADGDGQVGVGELRLVENAWSGPANDAGPARTVFDLDADGDIDLADQALLQQLVD